MTDDMQNVWQNQPVEPVQMSLDEIRRKAGKFRKIIWSRNLAEYIALGLAAAAFAFYTWLFHEFLVRAGAILEIAGAVYVAYQLYKRGSTADLPVEAAPKTCLEFHRAQLLRQRDLLRNVWSWYLGPFVPGMVLFMVGLGLAHPQAWPRVEVFLVVCGIFFFGIGKLNSRAARGLQRQIDALSAMEEKS